MRASLRKVGLLLGAASLLLGCDRKLPPGEFLKAYEEKGLVQSLAGDYRFTALLMSTDYMFARQFGDAPSGSQQPMESFRKAIYVSVNVTLANPTGDPEDLKKDLLNGALYQGQEAFRKRLDFLLNRLSPYVRLETADGSSLEPVTYRFSRGYVFGGGHSFVFLFPAAKDGKKVVSEGANLVLKDFGLNTGTVRIKIHRPSSIALKV